MKKLVIIIFLILILVSCVYFIYAQSNLGLTSKDSLRVEDFKIMKIYLGQPISEALLILGKPAKIKKDNIEQTTETLYYYPQLFISSSSDLADKVNYISIKIKGIKTFRGIEVGDDLKTIYNKYGKEKVNQGIVTYSKSYDSFWDYAISFVISNNIVKEIILSFATTTD